MLLSSDTTVGIAKSTGVGVLSFADALSDLNPDLILLLGDRYEIFAAATAAMFNRIPLLICTEENSLREPSMSLSAIASQKCPTFILLHPLSTAREFCS